MKRASQRHSVLNKVRMLVGKQKSEFLLDRQLLCMTCPFFRSRLEATGLGTLWFPEELPETFQLFVIWLYRRRTFRVLIDEAIKRVTSTKPSSSLVGAGAGTGAGTGTGTGTGTARDADDRDRDRDRDRDDGNTQLRADLHWNLVRLHLFAAAVSLPALQDAAIDGIQDLYLGCDWDMTPRFLEFLYDECEASTACRLRKWAVAMASFTLAGLRHHHSPGARALEARFHALFARHRRLRADYAGHLAQMHTSGADVGVKNPQLRLPCNRLLAEQRSFGFRQCSFHSHRAIVGEGGCPHAMLAGWWAGQDEHDEHRQGWASLPSIRVECAKH